MSSETCCSVVYGWNFQAWPAPNENYLDPAQIWPVEKTKSSDPARLYFGSS